MEKENKFELSSNKNNKKKEIKIDEKSELTFGFIVIIAKYYQSNNDFINTMKTNKQYKPLVSLYKFNPISDTTLFENIQTQHIYNEDDYNNLLENKYKYINWTENYYNKNNLINKRSSFNRNILVNKIDTLLKGDKLIIPNEFYTLEQLSISYSSSYKELIVLNNIKELYLPNSIRIIKPFSIDNLNRLEKLYLPDNKGLEINEKAINHCQSLNYLFIPPNMSIEQVNVFCGGSFYNTSITDIFLYNSFEERDLSDLIDQIDFDSSVLNKLINVLSVKINQSVIVHINTNYDSDKYFNEKYGYNTNDIIFNKLINNIKVIFKVNRKR